MNMEQITDTCEGILTSDVLPRIQNVIDECHLRCTEIIKTNIQDEITSLERKKRFSFSEKNKSDRVAELKERLVKVNHAQSPCVKLIQKDGTFYIYFETNYSSKEIIQAYRSSQGLQLPSHKLRLFIACVERAWNSSTERERFYELLGKEIIPVSGNFFQFCDWSTRDENNLRLTVTSEDVVLLKKISPSGYQLKCLLSQILSFMPSCRISGNFEEFKNIYEHQTYSHKKIDAISNILADRFREKFWMKARKNLNIRNAIYQPIKAIFCPTENSVTLSAINKKYCISNSCMQIYFFETKNYLHWEDYPTKACDIFINANITEINNNSQKSKTVKVAFMVSWIDPYDVTDTDIDYRVDLLKLIPISSDIDDWGIVRKFHSRLITSIEELE